MPWRLSLALLGLMMEVTGFRSFESGERSCTPNLTHGHHGLSLIRISRISSEVVPAGAEAVPAEIEFALEFDAAADSNFKKLRWDQLALHHGRRIHVVLVGADGGEFSPVSKSYPWQFNFKFVSAHWH